MKKYGIDLTGEELQAILRGEEIVCTFEDDEGNEETEVRVRVVEDRYE